MGKKIRNNKRVRKMAAQLNPRHRLAVLPGLSSRTSSTVNNDQGSTLGATIDRDTQEKLVVPYHSSPPNKMNYTLQQPALLYGGGNSLRSSRDNGRFDDQVQQVLGRVATLEDSNKALLEEVYRLQRGIRNTEFGKKEAGKDERKMHQQLMDTIRSSNDVIAQLAQRLRKAEEKLHREKDNFHHLNSHSKKLEQALYNAQKENDSQRDILLSQVLDVRHNVDGVKRKIDSSDRVSENIAEEFHQIKNKLEIQSLEFSHMSNELKQRTKRIEDEYQKSLQVARMQKDSANIAEQSNVQLRHLLESRITETRETISELRSRLQQSESESRTQVQQLTMKMSDVQSSLKQYSHEQQEAVELIRNSKKELEHSEETERHKIENKIKGVVESMSDKLLQKEVRLREEALKKFIDLERMLQKEESQRVEFERQLREENENRWNLQQKIMVEEVNAMKEMRRSDRAKHASNYKKHEEHSQNIEIKLEKGRKALEKVLLAEITKREVQSSNIISRVTEVQEQLRAALSSLQQAIGGIQLTVSKDKEQLMNDFKSRLLEEEQKMLRSIADFDTRFKTISMRVDQQSETVDAKIEEIQSHLRKELNDLVRKANDWRDDTSKELETIHDTMRKFPHDIAEVDERIQLMKNDTDTQFTLEQETRMKQEVKQGRVVKDLQQRIADLEKMLQNEKLKAEKLHRDYVNSQKTLQQVERSIADARSGTNMRLNSETRMRQEDTSEIRKQLLRLRNDVQPLLWEHNKVDKNFIKKTAPSLNTWGIYQVLRWAQIKQKWMDLLTKRRERIAKEKEEEEKEMEAPLPSSGTPQVKARKREEEDTAWYNQDKISTSLHATLQDVVDKAVDLVDEAVGVPISSDQTKKDVAKSPTASRQSPDLAKEPRSSLIKDGEKYTDGTKSVPEKKKGSKPDPLDLSGLKQRDDSADLLLQSVTDEDTKTLATPRKSPLPSSQEVKEGLLKTEDASAKPSPSALRKSNPPSPLVKATAPSKPTTPMASVPPSPKTKAASSPKAVPASPKPNSVTGSPKLKTSAPPSPKVQPTPSQPNSPAAKQKTSVPSSPKVKKTSAPSSPKVTSKDDQAPTTPKSGPAVPPSSGSPKQSPGGTPAKGKPSPKTTPPVSKSTPPLKKTPPRKNSRGSGGGGVGGSSFGGTGTNL